MAAKLKKQAESIADCDRALELDPNYTKALLRSGGLLVVMVIMIVFRRAKSYMETEQYEDAVRDYEKVHKADRSNMEYRYGTKTQHIPHRTVPCPPNCVPVFSCPISMPRPTACTGGQINLLVAPGTFCKKQSWS